MSRRKKPQRKTGQTGLDKLERELRASGKLPPGAQFVRRANGETKISAVFLEFLEPFKHATENRKQFETLIGIGVAAWNISLFQGAQRREMLDEVAKTILAETGQAVRPDLMGVLDDLIRHKEQFFAHGRRLIVSYHLQDTGASYDLSMVSTVQDAPAKQNL